MTIFAKKACRIIFLLGLSVGNSPATSLFWLRLSQSSFAIGKIIPIENIDAKEITHPLSKSLQGCSSNISIPARLIEEIISYSAPKYCASKKQKNMTAARKTELPNPVITA